MGVICVGEGGELQVPGDEGVRDSSAISDQVDQLALRKAAGQKASLGHQEGFLATYDICRVSMA